MKEGSRRDRFLVEKMLRHADVMAEVVRRGRPSFDSDPLARYALEHAVELFSEAAEKLSASFERSNPDVPWKSLRPLRREVAHPYDVGRPPIDPDRVWQFVRLDIPRIAQKLRRAKFPDPEA
ncbi:MAG: DUF86 domain-containing protein [Thermoplasmata archaeon]|nr:DUF86 domain-containing protein [Thermoplasmata archaeon]